MRNYILNIWISHADFPSPCNSRLALGSLSCHLSIAWTHHQNESLFLSFLYHWSAMIIHRASLHSRSMTTVRSFPIGSLFIFISPLNYSFSFGPHHLVTMSLWIKFTHLPIVTWRPPLDQLAQPLDHPQPVRPLSLLSGSLYHFFHPRHVSTFGSPKDPPNRHMGLPLDLTPPWFLFFPFATCHILIHPEPTWTTTSPVTKS